MDTVTLRKYEALGPFEIKNDLAKLASASAQSSADTLCAPLLAMVARAA